MASARLPFLLAFSLLPVFVALWVHRDLTIQRNEVSIPIRDQTLLGITVAVLSDFHISESQLDSARIDEMLLDAKESQADLYLLLGDYVSGSPREQSLPPIVREEVAQKLANLPKDKVIAVLGNHESWTGKEAWVTAFKKVGVTTLENQVINQRAGNSEMCVRGIGDAFTSNHQMTLFPATCDGKAQVTITHDPAAAFELGLEGIVFAGHTHCGQISLPLLPQPWIPSSAPRSATCGLYREGKLTLWVTSGTGTSVVPVRLGAPAQWDLITFVAEPH